MKTPDKQKTMLVSHMLVLLEDLRENIASISTQLPFCEQRDAPEVKGDALDYVDKLIRHTNSIEGLP